VARALLLVNRRASRADDATVGAARRVLEAAGLSVRVESPPDPATIPERIEAARDVDRILLAGGDGTLHRALPALVSRALPLGIVPLGTANDFARGLGIPLDAVAACRLAARARVRRVDLGQVEGQGGSRLFLNVASFGVSSRLAAELDAERKRRWGVLAYPLEALRAVRDATPFRVTVRLGDETWRTRALQVGVANGRHYGGGMTVDAAKGPADGRLAVFVLEAQGLLELARLLPRLWLGRLRDAERASIRFAPELGIETSRPLPIDADGELVACTPARFRVLHRALPVHADPDGTPDADG